MKIKKLSYRAPSASLTMAIMQIVFGFSFSVLFTILYVIARVTSRLANNYQTAYTGGASVTFDPGSFVSFLFLIFIVLFGLLLCQGIWGCMVYDRYRKLARVIMTRSGAINVRQLSEELVRAPSDIFADICATINGKYWSGYGLTESTLVLADGSKNSGTVLSGPDLYFKKAKRRSRASFYFFAIIFLPFMIHYGSPGFQPQFMAVAIISIVALLASSAALPKKLVITQHPGKVKEYKPEAVKTGVEETDGLLKDGLKYLEELIALDQGVSDQKIKKPVNELVDITRQIFDYVQKQPEKAKQIRQFVNYYLPTTIKLLKNYEELNRQPVKGDNIRESMKKIEGIMDGILFTFRQQLNDLYRDKNIDIAADIAVMENMISQDDNLSGK